MGQTIILVAIILTVVMNAQSTFVVGDAAERKVFDINGYNFLLANVNTSDMKCCCFFLIK